MSGIAKVKRIGFAAGALALCFAAPPGALAKGAVLHVCAGGHAGFSLRPDPLAEGPMVVPRDTVFRFAGAELDLSLGRHDGVGEPSDIGTARRNGRADRFERGMRANPAVMTERAIRLSRAARCGEVPAAALVSPRFGWSQGRVEGDGRLRFKPYGTVRKGRLSLGYEGAGASFRRAAIRGEVEATLSGETGRTVHLARRELDVIAHHRRRARRR